jgi:hypothetical protein
MLLRHIGLAEPSDGGDKKLCVEIFSVKENKNLTIHFTDYNANYDIKIFTYRRY